MEKKLVKLFKNANIYINKINKNEKDKYYELAYIHIYLITKQK